MGNAPGLASGPARLGRSGREKPGRVTDNYWYMTLRLELSDERLLADLMGSLARHGCLADRIGPNSCRIACPRAWSAHEARLEIGFFLRAWQVRHPGVEATLSA